MSLLQITACPAHHCSTTRFTEGVTTLGALCQAFLHKFLFTVCGLDTRWFYVPSVLPNNQWTTFSSDFGYWIFAVFLLRVKQNPVIHININVLCTVNEN